MSRADIAWITGIAVVAVTIAPALKAVGLLPHDLLVSWGMQFPGLEQVFFGPLMAALLLLCFVKTRRALVFPAIGLLRAFALGFVFPANLAHLGTGVAGILAGFIATALLRSAANVRFGLWLPLLAALYAGLYAAGNYMTACYFGPAAQTRIILLSPELAAAVVFGSFALGGLLGIIALAGMRLARALPSEWSTLRAAA
jgi:hypothetical protein